MMTTPLVSICCLTYNHEKYIQNAIEGFLLQKTDFPIEIIIHDDASEDNTPNIVKKYAEKYPSLIKPIYQEENKYSLGMSPSPSYVWPKAKGNYIAMCEGDDNWTDPLKLQKQVNFLEANPDYSLTSHEAYYTYINDPNSMRKFAAILYHNYRLDGIKRLLKLMKLFLTNNQKFWQRRRKSSRFKRYATADFEVALDTALRARYIPTLSIVVRSEFVKSIPKDMFKLGAGHRLIILWSALHGKIYHMADVMGFKNTQETSVTVTNFLKKSNNENYKYEHTIMLLRQLKEYAPTTYKPILEKKIKFYESKAITQEEI